LKGGIVEMNTYNSSKPPARRGNGFGRSLTLTSNAEGSSERGIPFCPEIIDASGKAIVRYFFFVNSNEDMRRVRREVRRDYRALSKHRTGLSISGRGLEYS
jgi:hypothetical protein